MNGYKVKNYFWLLIILTALVILMSGCSSSPKVADAGSHQYCYNNKTITVKNGQDVTSESITTCSDNIIEKLVAKQAGMAKNCGTIHFSKVKGATNVPNAAFACQRPDGHWGLVIDTDRR